MKILILKNECSNELTNDQNLNLQSRGEYGPSIENVKSAETVSIDENANIVEDEDELINRIKILIRKDKSKSKHF